MSGPANPSSGGGDQGAPPGVQLAVEIDVMPPALRPAHVFDYSGQMIASLLYDPLFGDGADPCTASAGAAEDAVTADGGRTWRIRLSPAGRWSDGSALTAGDLVRSVERLADPATASPMAWLAEHIEGVADARLGRISPHALPGCRADGEGEVIVRLRRPIAYADRLFAASCFAPVAADAEGEDLVSGPFRLAGMYPGERGLILESNRLSRRHVPGSCDRLAFLRTDGPEQGLRLYDAGLLDVTCNTTFPPAAVGRYRGSAGYLHQGLTMSAQIQAAPERLGPGHRRAISAAIGRHEVSALLGGVVRPLWRHSDLWFPDDEAVPVRRPDLARHLWRRAGEAPERLVLAYADFSPNGEATRAIAMQIEDALGVAVELRPLGYHDYLRGLVGGRFDLLYTLTPAAYDEPSCMLLPYRAGGFGARRAGFDAGEFTVLLDAAEAQPDLPQRIEGYRRAGDLLLAQMPFIPLFGGQSIVLHRADLQGFSMTRGGLVPFERIVVPEPQPSPNELSTRQS